MFDTDGNSIFAKPKEGQSNDFVDAWKEMEKLLDTGTS